MAMHGATTTGAFDRDEPRGFGSTIPTNASPFCWRGFGRASTNGELVMLLNQMPSPRLQHCRLQWQGQRCRVLREAPLGVAICKREAPFVPATYIGVVSTNIPENATSIGVLGCLNTHPLLHFFSAFPLNLIFAFVFVALAFSWLWRFRGFGNFCGMKYLFFKKLY